MVYGARDRPSGITILATLQVILGIVEVLTGLLLAIAYTRPPGVGDFATTLAGVPPTFSFLQPVLAVLWFTFAVLSFVLAYAIWTGSGWSWVVSLVFATNALTVGGFGLLVGSIGNVIPIAVITLVLISLGTPKVRRFLGRTPTLPAAYVVPPGVPIAYPQPRYSAPMYGPQTPTPQIQTASPWSWMVSCPTCGAQSYPNASFCTSCGRPMR